MRDALLALQAAVTKTASFTSLAVDLKTGLANWKALFARIIYSAATNASGLNSFQFGLEHSDRDITAYQSGNTAAISGATVAAPGVITSATHGLAVGDVVVVAGIVGTTSLNGTWIVNSVPSATTFSVKDFSGNPIAGVGAYSSGGTVTTWTQLTGDSRYLVPLTTAAQSGEISIPVITKRRYVRLVTTLAGGGSTPTITYQADLVPGRPG